MLVALALALAAASPQDTAPRDSAPQREALAEGVALYDSLEFEKAVVSFQKIVLDDATPKQTRAAAFVWLGLSYGQLGDTDAARQFFKRAVETDASVPVPDNAPPALTRMLETARADAAAKVRAARQEERKRAAAAGTGAALPGGGAPETGSRPAAGGAGGPGIAVVGSGVGAGVLAVAALGFGGFGLQQLSVAYDLSVPAKPALAAYDTAVACGVVAGVLGGAAAVAGGLAATFLALE